MNYNVANEESQTGSIKLAQTCFKTRNCYFLSITSPISGSHDS